MRHHPRRFGKTKYGLDRTLKVILDLMTAKFLLSYSNKPMRLFGGVGLGLILSGSAMLLYLFIRRFAGVPVLGSPVFQLAIMILILGAQSILMGLDGRAAGTHISRVAKETDLHSSGNHSSQARRRCTGRQ